MATQELRKLIKTVRDTKTLEELKQFLDIELTCREKGYGRVTFKLANIVEYGTVMKTYPTGKMNVLSDAGKVYLIGTKEIIEVINHDRED